MGKAKQLKGFENPADDGAPQLVEGVTGGNYVDKVREFIGANNGRGFMVSTEARSLIHGDKLVQTLHEFGAWRAYFGRLGLRIKIAHMDHRGYYMVPTQWPHEFAVGETSGIDYSAGNAFATEHQNRKAKEKNYGTAAMRQATIAAAKSRFPMRGKYPVTPESHKVKPPGIDVDQLMSDWKTDKEAQDKRDEERKARR